MTNRTDNFNRADTTGGNIGTPSDGGSAWVQETGQWDITGNKAARSSAATNYQVADLESSVSAVEVQVTRGAVSGEAGPAVRISDSSNYFAWSSSRLYRFVAGASTEIIPYVGSTDAPGDVIKIRVTSGNDFTVYRNAVSVGTANDSFNSTATKHGLMDFTGSGGNTFDDFSITAIGGNIVGSYFYQQIAGLGGGF